MIDKSVCSVRQAARSFKGRLPAFVLSRPLLLSCPLFLLCQLLLVCQLLLAPAHAQAASFSLEPDLATPLGGKPVQSGQNAQEAGGSSSPLRIVYVADSRGELFPCPTCGANASGGLARRATFIKRMRAEVPNTLYIVGPGEFRPDGYAFVLRSDPNPKYPDSAIFSAREVADAYAVGKPDAVYLSIGAASWFRAEQVELPKSFQPVSSAFPHRILEVGGRKIGLVFFAPLESASTDEAALKKLRQPLFDKALARGKELRPQVDLLIGISPWGQLMEDTFLPQADQYFDVLLGAGDGLPFAVTQRKTAPHVLWSRSDMRGRAVTTLDIMRYPARQRAMAEPWAESLNFASDMIYLGPEIQDDQSVSEILKHK